MDWLTDPETWIALGTLTALEIVLGIDNIIFISILASKLPRGAAGARPSGRPARRDGHPHPAALSLAWLVHLTAPLFALFGQGFSGRDLILLGGGLFLLAKATREIHDKLEGEEAHGGTGRPPRRSAP